MLNNLTIQTYERKITPIERLFSRSPSATVAVIVRIKGHVSESMLRCAISKVQKQHPNLRVRIKEDNDHCPWLTSEGAQAIPVEVIPRPSKDHWVEVYKAACQIPFEFDVRPAIRFILVQSPMESEMMILCHHIICDGLSLAYLARDLMLYLGHPNRDVDVLPDPVPIDRETIPRDVSLNPIVKFIIHRINQKWAKQKIYFDQEDYRNLNKAYWLNFRHRMLSVELSEAQTSKLVTRCRQENVTVNTALTTAFVGAQVRVQGSQPYHSTIGIAGNLRDRLEGDVGEVMGFYAGLITLKCNYHTRKGFWENARRFHRKITPLLTNKNLFKQHLAWCYLDPTILESFNFKKLGQLIPPTFTRYDKLSAFSKQKDAVLSLLKRGKADVLSKVFMGTAVTNLTRLDFPRKYGTLELDRLLMNPGSVFPLANINLVLGAVTCAGKLSLVIEYAEETVDTKTMEKINTEAMKFLVND